MTDQHLIPADQPPEGNVLIYRDGALSLRVRLDGQTVWLTQRLIAELFQITVPTVNEHLAIIYDEESWTRPNYSEIPNSSNRGQSPAFPGSSTTITSTRYSPSATASALPSAPRFRQWATARLSELLVKGFTLDDERIKAGRTLGDDYFEELLARIRDIRSSRADVLSEDHRHLRHQHRLRRRRRAHQDLLPDRAEQNALGRSRPHRRRDRPPAGRCRQAAHGPDDLEKRSRRSGAQRPMSQSPRTISSHDEIDALNRIVSAYLEFAELQAQGRRPMHMADWIAKLENRRGLSPFVESAEQTGTVPLRQAVLGGAVKLSERDILTHLGRISHQEAEDHAHAEFAKLELERRRLEASQPTSDFDKAVEEIQKLKREPKKIPRKRS